MDDELPRLTGRECESLQERQRLESPGQDRLYVQGEDVVERRAFERQESESAESTQELFAFLLRLLVARPHAGLQLNSGVGTQDLGDRRSGGVQDPDALGIRGVEELFSD